MVKDVKKLCPELDVESFGNLANIGVLNHRVIPLVYTRAADRIPPNVAQEIHTGVRNHGRNTGRSRLAHCGERSRSNWRSEAVKLQVVVRVSTVDGIAASWRTRTVREIEGPGALFAEGISPNENCKGGAATECNYSAHRPTTKGVLHKGSAEFWLGELP